MEVRFSPYDKIRFELFEILLPKLIYEDFINRDEFIYRELINNGGHFLYTLFNTMCEDDKISCSHGMDDFSVEVLKKGNMDMLQINLPPYRIEINDIVRAYLLLAKGKKGQLVLKYFLIKHFGTGHDFILYIPPTGGGIIGPEITGNTDNMDYEHNRLTELFYHIS